MGKIDIKKLTVVLTIIVIVLGIVNMTKVDLASTGNSNSILKSTVSASAVEYTIDASQVEVATGSGIDIATIASNEAVTITTSDPFGRDTYVKNEGMLIDYYNGRSVLDEYNQTENGTLVLNISSKEDIFRVNCAADLGGQLVVNFVNGYEPSGTIQLISAENIGATDNTFDNVIVNGSLKGIKKKCISYTETGVYVGNPVKGSAHKVDGKWYMILSDKVNGKGSAALYSVPSDSNDTQIKLKNMITVAGTKYRVTRIAGSALTGNETKVVLGKYTKSIGYRAISANVKTLEIKSSNLTKSTVNKTAFVQRGYAKSKLTIKVPVKKYKAYKKLLMNCGAPSDTKFVAVENNH